MLGPKSWSADYLHRPYIWEESVVSKSSKNLRSHITGSSDLLMKKTVSIRKDASQTEFYIQQQQQQKLSNRMSTHDIA